MRDNSELKTWVQNLYETHYDQLYDLGNLIASRYGMSHYQTVEDAIQEVFCIVVKKAAKLKTHPNIDGWLYLTLNNVMRDQRKASKRISNQVAFSFDDESHNDEKRKLEQSMASDDIISRISDQGDIDQLESLLGPNDARLFRMYCIDGCPASTVGRELGLSEVNVRVRAGRIRNKLMRHKELFLVLCLLFFRHM